MSNNNYGRTYPNQANVATPSNPYQTNISRTKTKKWVTAPTQNYDGDDWGDDFDEGSDEPKKALPEPVTGRNATNQRSTTAEPDIGSSPFSTGARSTFGPPTLQLQTQQPTGGISPGDLPSSERRPPATGDRSPASAVQSPTSIADLPSRQGTTSPPIASPSGPLSAHTIDNKFPTRESSLGTQDGLPNLTKGSQTQEVRGSGPNKPWMDARSASPQGPRSPPEGTKPAASFVRPSDIYRRMEEEKGRQRQSPDSSRPRKESVTATDSSRPRKESVAATDSSRPRKESVAGRRPSSTERTRSPATKSRSSDAGAHGKVRSRRSSPDKKITTTKSSRTNRGAGSSTATKQKSDHGLKSPADPAMNFLLPDSDSENETEAARPATNPTNPATATASPQEPGLSADPKSPPKTVGGASERQSLAAAAAAKESPTVSTGDRDHRMNSSGQHAKTNVGTDAQQAKAKQDYDDADEDDEGLRRYSSSPKLPDLARMSSFGFDFLASSTLKEEDQPPVPVIANEHKSGSHPVDSKAATESDSKFESLGDDKARGTIESNQQQQQQQQESNADSIKMEVTKPLQEEGAVGRSSPAQTPTPAADESANVQTVGLGLAPGGKADEQSATELPRKVSQRKPLPAPKLEPVARTATMDTTATASPVKESDKLTDEIIKSLSPQVTPSETLTARTPFSDGSVPRESAYLGDVYDYYGTFDEKADEDEDRKRAAPNKTETLPGSPLKGQVLSATPKLDAEVQDGSMSPKPLNTAKKPQPPSVDDGAKLRHKFSWEAGRPEEVNPPASPTLPSLVIPTLTATEPKNLAAVPPSGSPAQSPSSLLPSPVPYAPNALENPISPISPSSIPLERQISESSMLPPGFQLSSIEPPSPLSALPQDAQDIDMIPEPKTLNLAEEKAMITTTTSPIKEEHPALSPVATAEEVGDDRQSKKSTTTTPTAPGSPSFPVEQPALDSPSVKVWTFREILNLPTSEERTERMIETRHVFAKLDSGLGPWLGAMTTTPEHTNASSLLREDMSYFTGDNHLGTGINQHPVQPQHHHPQYMNASSANIASPGGAEPGVGRPLSGSANLSHLTSEFRHSGAKGKELLKSAGKVSKGLFSKGKSKLQTAREEWR